jgi:hypothetical protein
MWAVDWNRSSINVQAHHLEILLRYREVWGCSSVVKLRFLAPTLKKKKKQLLVHGAHSSRHYTFIGSSRPVHARLHGRGLVLC